MSERIIGGLATMPTRADTAEIAIASILPNVDKLYVFLDGFSQVPDYFNAKKITLFRSQEEGDLRANGKFLGLSKACEKDVYVCFDDDLKYPRNYTAWLKFNMKYLPERAAVGIHGSVFHKEIHSYHDRGVFIGKKAQWIPRRVDVLATNACMHCVRHMQFDVKKWSKVNMVDLHFATEAFNAGIKLWTIPRYANWVRYLQEEQSDSIFSRLLKDDSEQIKMLKSLLRKTRN